MTRLNSLFPYCVPCLLSCQPPSPPSQGSSAALRAIPPSSAKRPKHCKQAEEEKPKGGTSRRRGTPHAPLTRGLPERIRASLRAGENPGIEIIRGQNSLFKTKFLFPFGQLELRMRPQRGGLQGGSEGRRRGCKKCAPSSPLPIPILDGLRRRGKGGREGGGAAKAAASTTSLALLHVVVVCMEVFFGRCSHPATHLAPG